METVPWSWRAWGEATLWGLVMAHVPVKRGDSVTIVWRMTGSGPVKFTASMQDGTTTALTWGPVAHGASSFRRPGDEWGTGYQFPRPGCWKLHAERDVGSGDAWLRVE